MTEEETIRLFIKNGYQLSKNALPLVLPNPEQIISELSKLKPRPLFVTEYHIKKLSPNTVKINIQVLKEYKTVKKKLKIENYVNFLCDSYDKIKPILLKKMKKEKIISINKISSKTNTFSLIGITREMGDNNIILEDPSGETPIHLDNKTKYQHTLNLDDIIGVNCKKIKEKIFAQKIFYPDLFSSREINKTSKKIKITVISSLSSLENYKKTSSPLETKDQSLIFVFSNKDEKVQEITPNTNIIRIEKNSHPKLLQLENIKILILPIPYPGIIEAQRDKIDFIVSILKRRVMPFKPIYNVDEDNFFLDDPPDIIISNLKESCYKNYKGITIISNSDPSKVFVLDLKNRTIEEKRL